METAPIRIREEDKRDLDELRSEVAAASGKRPTLQDTLAATVAFARRNKEAFLAEVAWTPLSDEETDAWMRAPRPGWRAVAPKDIDDVVYGGR